MSETKLTQENLAPLKGQTFKAKNPDGQEIELTLTEVNEYTVKGIEAEAFTAIFSNEADCVADGATYELAHEAIGENKVTVSLNSATECEVVVNRLKEPLDPPATPE